MLALRENVETGVAAWLRAGGAGGVLFLGLCLSASEALADPDQPRTEYFTASRSATTTLAAMWARVTPSARLDTRRLVFACAPSALTAPYLRYNPFTSQ